MGKLTHSFPKRIRIAVVHFSHETVTFLPNDTQLSDFVYEGSPCRDDALLAYDPNGYIGGFVQCAREFTEVDLVGIQSPLFPKTGIGSGWVTNEAYEHFVGEMIQDLQERGPFDGVYMALHGAMAARGVAHPEAELAARIRKVVGPEAILAATFDPHGNEDEKFHQSADLAFCVKFYPHYDTHLQGERAARTMVRSIRGEYRPTSACIKVPILSPTVMQWTGASPWMDLVQRALVWEARKPGVYVNVFFGFPWADTADAGMTIQVTSNGDQSLAQEVAKDMANVAWRLREALTQSTKVHSIEEGVSLALQAVENGQYPVVLADHSDRSGHATWLFEELQRRDTRKTLLASIAEGELVKDLIAQGIRPGDPFDHEIGGRVDPSAGVAVRVVGTVLGSGMANDGTGSRSEWISVALGNGNVVVISAYLMQIIEPGMLTKMGLNVGEFEIFAIKSRVHFRRGFDDSGFAARIFLVEPESPFLGTTRLDALAYEHVRIGNFYPYGLEEFEAD
ncbi:M81 family metallopeptidase [Ottowia thiooxydans]|uniref:M81 family metallopeptidase n=1 Tax=Ottowia thiooxydans TaxID=219182 RepID=UPI0005607BC5|nr:M81 family metallopeptidase [Ottowia thiooxydans]